MCAPPLPRAQRIATHRGPVALSASDVTGANREVTLGVLWGIANNWQVNAPMMFADSHRLRLVGEYPQTVCPVSAARKVC